MTINQLNNIIDDYANRGMDRDSLVIAALDIMEEGKVMEVDDYRERLLKQYYAIEYQKEALGISKGKIKIKTAL